MGLALGLALWPLAFCGCLTQLEMLKPLGSNPDGQRVRSQNADTASDLGEARRCLETSDYTQAMTRLQSIISNTPDTPSGIEARYWLGLAYFRSGGYRDSQAYFNEYLARAPQGKYAPEAREHLAELVDMDSHLAESIRQFEEKRAAGPLPEADRLRLADLYWRKGRYPDAGTLYQQLLAEKPELIQDELIARRVERGPGGALLLLTPQEQERRVSEQEPVTIVNMDTINSRKFRGWEGGLTADDYYQVTGSALNRGNKTVYNVQVTVTLYKFGSKILDTETIGLGSLAAGTTKPFSVRFTQLDTLGNIVRSECSVSYTR